MSRRPRLSVAPMMALTDRHFRFLARALSPSILLYSEMLTAKAVINGDRDYLLGKDEAEGDVVLQLGGDDPRELAAAAAIGEEYGYVEVNLNVGCPSARVASGNFGACLMARPELVGRSLAAMKAATSLPVSVKHRIGIDHADAYEDLRRFVDVVDEVSGGVASAYVVHARKAWLQGLSPKENRTVPPLRYHDVHRLKAERPDLVIEINGGMDSVAAARQQLGHVDGVMIGRAAYDDPALLVGLESLLAGGTPGPSGRQLVERMVAYAEERLAAGAPLAGITRHLLNLFKGAAGARAWRRTLTEGAPLAGSGPELLLRALAALPDEVADRPLGGELSAPAAARTTAAQAPAASTASAAPLAPAASAAAVAMASAGDAAQVLAGDDQMLDLVGAFADAR